MNGEVLKRIKKERDEKKKENLKKRMAKYRKLNPNKSKEATRTAAAKYRKENPKKSKEATRIAAAKYRKENPKKSKEATRTAAAKYRKENPEKSKEATRRAVAKFRECKDEMDRLRKFREATMYGPIFICVSCHIKCFQSNVQVFKLDIIRMKPEECIQNYIEDTNIVSQAKTIYCK